MTSGKNLLGRLIGCIFGSSRSRPSARGHGSILLKAFKQKLEHDTCAERQILPRWIYDRERKVKRRKVRQELPRPPLTDVAVDLHLCKERDSQSLNSGATNSLGIVCQNTTANSNSEFAFRRREPPDVIRLPVMIGYAVMAR